MRDALPALALLVTWALVITAVAAWCLQTLSPIPYELTAWRFLALYLLILILRTDLKITL